MRDTLVVRRVRTDDGVDLAAYDFGGTGPDLLLAHATGFHARAFLPLVSHLRRSFHCYGFDERGHGASSPPPDGNYDWHRFADDALAVAQSFGLDRPAAFGHSAGGALLVLAEQRHPGSWRGLYLYEPVLPPAASMPAELAGQNPLVDPALRRRRSFASRRAAYDNYASKPPLSALDPEALEAYVQYGFVDRPDGSVQLACAPEAEAATYRMALQHEGWNELGSVRCPTTVAGGDGATAFGPDATSVMASRLPRGRNEVLAGLGHFGPLERPIRLSRSIAAALAVPDDG